MQSPNYQKMIAKVIISIFIGAWFTLFNPENAPTFNTALQVVCKSTNATAHNALLV